MSVKLSSGGFEGNGLCKSRGPNDIYKIFLISKLCDVIKKTITVLEMLDVLYYAYLQ